MENQIDYIEFPASDIPATKHFYNEVFGWTFTDYGPDYTSFTDGRLGGGFSKERAVTAPGVLVVLYASDLRTIQERITAAGGRIVREIFSFPGGTRFHFADPNGNELALWSDK